VTNFFQNTCGITPEEKQLSVSGRNWGEVDLNGQSYSFLFKLSILIDFLPPI
jgi:structure-specific recognition protein 1